MLCALISLLMNLQFLLKNLFFDIRPAFFVKVVEGFGVSEVIDSDDPNFKQGDIISGFTGWEEYSLLRNTEQLRRVQPDNKIPLSYHIGLLGLYTNFHLFRVFGLFKHRFLG